MEILLFTIGLLILLAGGVGIVLLVRPDRGGINIPEVLSLGFLCGVSLVALSSFIAGFLIDGVALRIVITIFCLALFTLGRMRTNSPLDLAQLRPANRSGWLLLLLIASQIGFVLWLSQQTNLGWDGALIWEFKARITHLNRGVIPLDYFRDYSRTWSHSPYPLTLSLAEAWFYGWMGQPDQETIKWFPPLFYAAALGLFGTAISHLGGDRWLQFLAPILLFTMKFTLLAEGSATSGYADFPLAVFYLASVVYLAAYWRTGDVTALCFTGLLAGLMCWVKQEGSILWICVMLLVALAAWRRGHPRRAIPAALPGLVILIGWGIFLRIIRPIHWDEFMPVSPSNLLNNIGRAPALADHALQAVLYWKDWGLMWPLAVCAALWLATRRQPRWALILPAAVFLPLAAYFSIYFFSNWSDYLLHFDNSFARLLLHLSLTAELMVLVAIDGLKSVFKRGYSSSSKSRSTGVRPCPS